MINYHPSYFLINFRWERLVCWALSRSQIFGCRFMISSCKSQCPMLKVLSQNSYGKLRFHYLQTWRCPWCNGYRRRKWTRRDEFKSRTRLIAFHIALIP